MKQIDIEVRVGRDATKAGKPCLDRRAVESLARVGVDAGKAADAVSDAIEARSHGWLGGPMLKNADGFWVEIQAYLVKTDDPADVWRVSLEVEG